MNRLMQTLIIASVVAALNVVCLAQSPCDADTNADGVVDGIDLATLLGSWGPCKADDSPSVKAITPNSGPTTGGAMAFIEGTRLELATSVTIGGQAATIEFANNSTLAVRTPASGVLGAQSVIVHFSESSLVLDSAYSYVFQGPTPPWATLLEPLPDPTIVTETTVRRAMILTGLPWRVRDNATQIEMVLVPPGSFQMGCTASNQYGCSTIESPAHAVTITNSFYIARYEVTQAQWTSRMGSNPSFFVAANGYGNSSNKPVDSVSWNALQSFLQSTGLRLPSEAEWEYACRAGTTSAFNNGSSDDALVGNIAWFSGNNGAAGSSGYGTKPVGLKAPNALGLYDMSGNVWEWCADWYGNDYYANSPSTNPAGPPSGSNKMIRGGCWSYVSGPARSSARDSMSPTQGNALTGFRVARNP